MGWVRTLAVIVSLILVACFFLPYSSLTEESKTMLDTAYALYSDEEMETAAIEQEGPIIESRDGSLSVFEMTTWYFERLKEEGSAWMTVFPAAIGLLRCCAASEENRFYCFYCRRECSFTAADSFAECLMGRFRVMRGTPLSRRPYIQSHRLCWQFWQSSCLL